MEFLDSVDYEGLQGSDQPFQAGSWQDSLDQQLLQRIEDVVLEAMLDLREGRLPRVLQAAELADRPEQHPLIARQGESASSYARLFAVLERAHEHLRTGRTVTLRDLYYRLKTSELFKSPSDVSKAVSQAAAMLGVPRSALGIACGSKGAFAGRIRVQQADGSWQDGTQTTLSGLTIPGTPRDILPGAFETDARCVVIVEKEAVFARLVEDRFYDLEPSSILVTAKGMPDVATRLFLSRLCSAYSHLHTYCVVDWNPAGVAIMSQYKWGGQCNSVEEGCEPLPNLQWLAARHAQLADLPPEAMQPLTSRDRAMIRSQTQALSQLDPDAVQELAAMRATGCKAEIEALQELTGLDGFSHALAEELQALHATSQNDDLENGPDSAA